MSAPHQRAIISLVDLATRYCALIERAAGRTAAELLVEAERHLPALYSAVLDLPDTEPTTDDWQTRRISHEEWLTIYRPLCAVLGLHDPYREI